MNKDRHQNATTLVNIPAHGKPQTSKMCAAMKNRRQLVHTVSIVLNAVAREITSMMETLTDQYLKMKRETMIK